MRVCQRCIIVHLGGDLAILVSLLRSPRPTKLAGKMIWAKLPCVRWYKVITHLHKDFAKETNTLAFFLRLRVCQTHIIVHLEVI